MNKDNNKNNNTNNNTHKYNNIEELLKLFHKFLISLFEKENESNLITYKDKDKDKDNCNDNDNDNIDSNKSYESKKEILTKLFGRVPKNINEYINIFEIQRLGMSKLDINAISYYYSGAGSEIYKEISKNLKKFYLSLKCLEILVTQIPER
jgi:hypothetical protein